MLKPSKINIKANTKGIPNIFTLLFPKMRIDQYLALKNEEHFKNRTVLVCESCFYFNSKLNVLSGAKSTPTNNFKTVLKEDLRKNFLNSALKNISVKIFKNHIF